MSAIENMTIGQLRGLDAVNPRMAMIGRRLLANGGPYTEFVEVLYETIDSCIRTIEEDPKIRLGDGEDRLTSELIAMLRSAGYDASHDTTIGGHSDIVVKSLRGDCWVGEAKIHGGYDYLEQGWNQLTTRYMRGTPGYDMGGLLLYIRNKDCRSVIETWRNNLLALNLPQLKISDCLIRGELGFYSVHEHGDTGRIVRVRHMGINLCWNPS